MNSTSAASASFAPLSSDAGEAAKASHAARSVASGDMKILNSSQMRAVDRVSIEELGIPGLLLMENAGRSVADLIQAKFSAREREHIVVLCGKGNNGGDGFVVARHLKMRGHAPRVVLLADPQSLKGDARANYDHLLRVGLQPAIVTSAEQWQAVRGAVRAATLLVDAILGTGLGGPVEGFLSGIIRDLNGNFANIPIVAVDIPSGLPSDTGEPLGESLRARCTVTFTAPKWGHIFPPNCERVGELVVTPIGTPPSVYENNPAHFLNLLTPEVLAPLQRKRAGDSHKGDYGHVLVVGGSRGKSGAAALASLAALRAGAGLVTAATATSVLPMVAAASPVLMTEPLAETDAGSISARAFDYGRFAGIVQGKSALAIGPGLSTDPDTVEFVRRAIRECAALPVVIDADALNAFAGAAERLQGEGRKLVLTPHPGEMSRLTGLSTQEVQARRVEVAREFAQQHKVCLVLKGYRTLIAEPGGQVYVNPTGNPGMATGGTGDVLTGMIAALLAQFPELPVEQAVPAAVYWHGAAGDVAAEAHGEISLIATDLLEALPQALRQTPSPVCRDERC